MAHIVCEPCVGCKYTDCVEVCPVEAFHEGPVSVFINPETWTESLAEAIAIDMGISGLTDQQWEMIYFLRNFYLSIQLVLGLG